MILGSTPLPWLSLVCFAIACAEPKADPIEEEVKTKREVQETILEQLRTRYPGINEFKASDDPLTITLQDEMRRNPLFLMTGFVLNDVRRHDSLWVVSLKDLFWSSNILELTTNDSLLTDRVILESIPERGVENGNRHFFKGPKVLVVRLRAVNRMELHVMAEGERDGEEVNSRILLDADLPLHLAGELVEVH